MLKLSSKWDSICSFPVAIYFFHDFANWLPLESKPGEGGGEVLIIYWVGCAARSWKPLPYFRPKYTIFHTLFQTWLSKIIPYFRPCDVWQIRQLSINLGRTGLCDSPNDVHFFFFAINVHGSTRYSKNGIPDQIDGIYTLFQTKMAKSIPYFRLEMLKNGTLCGGTYLYGLYMGVPPPKPPPPPPPPPDLNSKIRWWQNNHLGS